MTLQRRLKTLNDRINSLSLRERGLLLLAILAVLFFIWDLAIMRPIDRNREAVQQQLEQVQERVDKLSESIQRMVQAQRGDPNEALRTQRRALEQENERLRERINALHGGVSTPRLAVDMLARLLADRPGLDLVELENLPPERLIRVNLEGSPGLGGIFVHRVRLVVETDFSGVLEYMGLIEELPEGVYWESVRLDVPDWPTNRVEMVLYTLALDDGWLGI